MKIFEKQTWFEGGTAEEQDALPITGKALKSAIAALTTDFDTKFGARFTKTDSSLEALLAKLNTPPAPPAPVVAPPAPAPKGSTMVDPQTNAQILELTNKQAASDAVIKQLTDANKAALDKAERMEREGALRAVLNDYRFVKPEGQEDVFQLLLPKVVRDDVGNLIADNLPVKDFVKAQMASRFDYALAPEPGTSGTGARQYQTRGSGPSAQLEDIKVGMTDAQYEAAGAEILTALAGSGLGR